VTAVAYDLRRTAEVFGRDIEPREVPAERASAPASDMHPVPLISVVMAVRHASATIDEQLAALARQTMAEPWEVVVVDNGSSDDTAVRVLAWQSRVPSLRLVPGPSEPSRSKPLNVGVAAARSERLAFCDADDIVSEGWVEAMCRALAEHAHVTGPIDLARLNPPELVPGDEVARSLVRPTQHTFMPFAMGCNTGWQRDAFCSLGGFDEGLPSGQDKDLSWRTQLAGHELWFEPAATVHRRLRSTMLAAFRQHVRYGRSNTRLALRFQPYGAVSRSARSATHEWAVLLLNARMLLHRGRRVRWAAMAGRQVGRTLPLSKSSRRSLSGSEPKAVWLPGRSQVSVEASS
jgi:glycosyltransferase involved in cell wall biosynthesis